MLSKKYQCQEVFTCSQFHEVLEKAKLIYGDGNVNSGGLLGVWELNGNGLRDLCG